jgi:hypothetical protein
MLDEIKNLKDLQVREGGRRREKKRRGEETKDGMGSSKCLIKRLGVASFVDMC